MKAGWALRVAIQGVLWAGLMLYSSGQADAADAGTTGGAVLGISNGARAIAMGEAYTALADDASSIYWNPGGIAWMNQSQASFLYNQFLDDLTYNNVSVATPLEHGGIGASVRVASSYGDITGSDASGNETGNVNAYSSVGSIGGGLLFDNFAAGLNVKGIQDKLADEKATGFAADLGFSMYYPKPVFDATLRTAFTVRNLGPGLKYLNQTDPLPREWRLGVAAVQMFKRKVSVSLDYGQQRGLDGGFYAGVEYWPFKYIALRTGYAGDHGEGSPLRAGLGLKLKDLSLDYAFSDHGALGAAHRYEMSWRFGVIVPRLTPEERAILRRAKLAMSEGRYGEATMLLDSLIQLVPNYRPARRLVTTAMAQYEKAPKDTSVALHGVLKPKTMSAYDTDDIRNMEQLLALTEDSSPATAKGHTQEIRP